MCSGALQHEHIENLILRLLVNRALRVYLRADTMARIFCVFIKCFVDFFLFLINSINPLGALFTNLFEVSF